MNAHPAEEHDNATLRWGGLAGVAGSVLLLLVFGIVAAFVGTDTMNAEQALRRFPDIRTARTVENGLYLAVLLLWVVHGLALYRALRRTSPARALFGTVLSTVGLAVLAAGALPHVATAPIAELYHAPGATAADQATLVLLWQASYGILDMLLVTGLVVVPTGLLALGTAMRGAPGFGARSGATAVTLGVAGLVAGIAVLVDVSPVAVVGVLALVAFHLIVGWTTHRLATARRPSAPGPSRPASVAS